MHVSFLASAEAHLRLKPGSALKVHSIDMHIEPDSEAGWRRKTRILSMRGNSNLTYTSYCQGYGAK